MFIFKEVLFWWRGCKEVVTNNVPAMVVALDWLSKTYHINHIWISAYNSRANGIVKCSHRTIRDSIVKACNGDITQWPEITPHAFWADWVTTREATGHSPFYNTHGTEPLLPFDIMEATFMLPPITTKLSTSDLLRLQAHQLAKKEDDLAKIHDNVVKACFASIAHFEKQFKTTIHNYDFQTGDLVLVLNKALVPESNTKCKLRYFEQMLVICRAAGGSYHPVEIDSAVSKPSSWGSVSYYTLQEPRKTSSLLILLIKKVPQNSKMTIRRILRNSVFES